MIQIEREKLETILEALEFDSFYGTKKSEAITSLRQAIAEAKKHKPLAWMDREGDVYKKEPPENWCPPHTPLYTHPQPKREPLTDEIVGLLKEARKIIRASSSRNLVKDWDERTTKAIAHGIKGEA